MEQCEICDRKDGTVNHLCVSAELKDVEGGVSVRLDACARCRTRIYNLSVADLVFGIRRILRR